MKTLQCTLPDSLYDALETQARSEGASVDHVVTAILARGTGTEMHTLFQVSTSSALVEGLYQGAVRVGQLLVRGNFGLGTFIDLDGEMVVLDGACYQVEASGRVTVVDNDRFVPYAVVTSFEPESSLRCTNLSGLDSLIQACDSLRQSNNIFYAFRVEGKFSSVRTRIMRSVGAGTRLREAASGQAEFLLESQEGTLVGLWSPGFAGSFVVPGYHFHFLSCDRTMGGHILDCDAADVVVAICAMNEMHVSLPETEQFLRANLSRDPKSDLKDAEQKH